MQCMICKKECLDSELKDGICEECLEKGKKIRISTNNNKVLDKVMFGVKSKNFEDYNSIAKHWIWLSRRFSWSVNTIMYDFFIYVRIFKKYYLYFDCNTKLLYHMANYENNW